MQMLMMRRLRSAEDNVSIQVKTLSLSVSPHSVMYGVRTCLDSWSVLNLENIDVGGINLNTQAILVSGLLIDLLWRTDFILILKEFVILYLIYNKEENLKLETGQKLHQPFFMKDLSNPVTRPGPGSHIAGVRILGVAEQ